MLRSAKNRSFFFDTNSAVFTPKRVSSTLFQLLLLMDSVFSAWACRLPLPKLDALTFFVECIAQQSTGLQASCLGILGNLGRSGERREPSLGIVIVWQKNVASFPRNTCNVYTTFSDSGNLCERLIGQNIKMFVPCCPFCCSETYSKFIGKKGVVTSNAWVSPKHRFSAESPLQRYVIFRIFEYFSFVKGT